MEFQPGDALVVVDVQNDFLPGGSLAVPHGDEVIPVLHRYIRGAMDAGIPIYATRDWHPPQHCSFKEQGGTWPVHCVARTYGAEFPQTLLLPPKTIIVSKATTVDADAYSGFQGTDLDTQLHAAGVRRLYIGGLATDYCVLNTVRDALRLGYQVILLRDAIRAVNVQPQDGAHAEDEMLNQGAVAITLAGMNRNNP